MARVRGHPAMVELRTGTSGSARGRAATWRPGTGAPAWVWPNSLGGFAGGATQRLFGWVLAEVAPGRLTPWLAVSFGFGTVLYFAVEQEPALSRRARLRPPCWCVIR